MIASKATALLPSKTANGKVLQGAPYLELPSTPCCFAPSFLLLVASGPSSSTRLLTRYGHLLVVVAPARSSGLPLLHLPPLAPPAAVAAAPGCLP